MAELTTIQNPKDVLKDTTLFFDNGENIVIPNSATDRDNRKGVPLYYGQKYQL